MFAATILPAAAQTAGVDRVEPDLGAAVKQYCVACHNSRALIGNLALDEVESDAASLGANAELWEKVIVKFRARDMPPPAPAGSMCSPTCSERTPMNVTHAIVAVLTALVMTTAASAGARDTPLLIDAVKAGDLETVRELVADPAMVDAAQGDGATALHWAVHRNDPEAASLLIGAGADVNAANAFGTTPVWLAAENGSAAMLERLLAAGASPNVALTNGETPLMTAARVGVVEAVETLIAHAANVHLTEALSGQTALMWAAEAGSDQITKVLIEAGADVTQASTLVEIPEYRRRPDRTAGGFTPLMFAARSGDLSTARLLVEAGADVNRVAPDGTTPLIVATVRAHVPLAIWLLEQGADANVNRERFTALHRAAGSWATELTGNGPSGVDTDRDEEWLGAAGVPGEGRVQLVEALLKHGADPNIPLVEGVPKVGYSNARIFGWHDTGATPFWLAARSVYLDVMKVLVEYGADPSLGLSKPEGYVATPLVPPPAEGTSPLMAAMGTGRSRLDLVVPAEDVFEAAELILELGTDPNGTDVKGMFPLFQAASSGNDALVKLLVDAGADVNLAMPDGETALDAARGKARRSGASLGRKAPTHESTVELLLGFGATEGTPTAADESATATQADAAPAAAASDDAAK